MNRLHATTASALALACASLSFIRPATAGETVALTADEVARRAQATSFEIKARADERIAAEAAVDQAIAAYWPRLSGTARYTRLSQVPATSLGNIVVAPATEPGSTPAAGSLVAMPLQFPSIVNQYLAQATLQVPLSDYLLRLPQAHEAAVRNAQASALTVRATRLRIATDARVAYYQWLRARSQVQIAEKALEQAQGHLADVKHVAETQSASTADVLRVESQVAAAELLLERTRNLVVVSETQLRTLMHDNAPTTYQAAADVASPVAGESPEAVAVETLWNEAAGKRLELRVLDESAGAVREQAKAALAGGLPRLDAVGNALTANPNQRIFPQSDSFRSSWDVSIQLSWSPTDLPAASAARRSALAHASALDDQRAAVLDGIKLEVTQAVRALAEARVAIETARRGERAAEESCRIRQLLFHNGRATSVELTDAETDLLRTRMDALAAQIELRVAHARLVHALGRDID